MSPFADCGEELFQKFELMLNQYASLQFVLKQQISTSYNLEIPIRVDKI